PQATTEAATRTDAGSAWSFQGSVTSGRRSIPGRDLQPPGRARPVLHRAGPAGESTIETGSGDQLAQRPLVVREVAAAQELAGAASASRTQIRACARRRE